MIIIYFVSAGAAGELGLWARGLQDAVTTSAKCCERSGEFESRLCGLSEIGTREQPESRREGASRCGGRGLIKLHGREGALWCRR